MPFTESEDIERLVIVIQNPIIVSEINDQVCSLSEYEVIRLANEERTYFCTVRLGVKLEGIC